MMKNSVEVTFGPVTDYDKDREEESLDICYSSIKRIRRDFPDPIETETVETRRCVYQAVRVVYWRPGRQPQDQTTYIANKQFYINYVINLN